LRVIQELVNYLIQNLWLAALVAGLLLFVLLVLVARAATRRLRGSAPEAGTRSAPSAAPGPQLLLPDGATRTLPGLPATLGRAGGSTIVLRDPAVSATHARIYFDELLQAVCIEDCDSTNGLYVDGQPTRKNVLRDNARITLGATTLTFRDGGSTPPARGGASQGTGA
jgi:hypothetical protein